MIQLTASGSFDNIETYLNKLQKGDAFKRLERYGQMGVDLLAAATPVDSGLTASSWTYKVIRKNRRYTIVWNNTNFTEGGGQVAILIQYGHGTGTGGWVEGRDYINPAIQPLFDQIANDVWNEVISHAR